MCTRLATTRLREKLDVRNLPNERDAFIAFLRPMLFEELMP